MSRLLLRQGNRLEHEVAAGRGAWQQVARGSATVSGADSIPITLEAGDGASTHDSGRLAIIALANFEALLFRLALSGVSPQRSP